MVEWKHHDERSRSRVVTDMRDVTTVITEQITTRTLSADGDWGLLDRETRDFKLSFNGVKDKNEQEHYNKLNLGNFRFATNSQVFFIFVTLLSLIPIF